MTYLDLPLDVLHSVIRHLSSRPLLEKWPAFISPGDAETLFSNGGPLGQEFRSRFKDVSLSTKSSSTSNTLVLNPDINDSHSHQRYTTVAGTLESVSYDGEQRNDKPSAQTKWLQVPLPALLRAQLHGMHRQYLTDFLSAAPVLKSLSLDKYTSSRAHLLIVAQRCSDLERISFHFHKATPNQLWQKHGATLTHVDVTMCEIVPLFAIQSHCASLKSLAIRSHFQVPGLVQLLESIGMGLESLTADLRNLTHADLSRIAAACPKANFDILGVLRAGMIARLGYRVPTLRLNKSTPLLCQKELCIFDEYHTLQELTLSLTDEKAFYFIERLLVTHKPKLEKLNLTIEQNSSKKVLEHISSRVSSLREISLVVREFPMMALCHLMSVNQQIIDVNVTARRVTPNDARQLVKFSANCRNLKYLVIKESIPTMITARDVSRINEDCRLHRLRGVSVQVNGVDYVY